MQTNNKLREALEALVDVIDKYDSGSPLWWHSGAKGVKPLKDARAALAEPVKNCDVGTAEEQYRRHDKFCDTLRNGMSGYHCEDAPRCVFCFAKWAQMPYEEGGAK